MLIGETGEFIKDTFAIVEATDFEKLILWETWNKRIKWVDNNIGKSLRIAGQIESYISVWSSEIGGKKVLFWHATSSRVDYNEINNWFRSNIPDLDRYETDANNFHIIIHAIMRANGE